MGNEHSQPGYSSEDSGISNNSSKSEDNCQNSPLSFFEKLLLFVNNKPIGDSESVPEDYLEGVDENDEYNQDDAEEVLKELSELVEEDEEELKKEEISSSANSTASSKSSVLSQKLHISPTNISTAAKKIKQILKRRSDRAHPGSDDTKFEQAEEAKRLLTLTKKRPTPMTPELFEATVRSYNVTCDETIRICGGSVHELIHCSQFTDNTHQDNISIELFLSLLDNSVLPNDRIRFSGIMDKIFKTFDKVHDFVAFFGYKNYPLIKDIIKRISRLLIQELREFVLPNLATTILDETERKPYTDFFDDILPFLEKIALGNSWHSLELQYFQIKTNFLRNLHLVDKQAAEIPTIVCGGGSMNRSSINRSSIDKLSKILCNENDGDFILSNNAGGLLGKVRLTRLQKAIQRSNTATHYDGRGNLKDGIQENSNVSCALLDTFITPEKILIFIKMSVMCLIRDELNPNNIDICILFASCKFQIPKSDLPSIFDLENPDESIKSDITNFVRNYYKDPYILEPICSCVKITRFAEIGERESIKFGQPMTNKQHWKNVAKIIEKRSLSEEQLFMYSDNKSCGDYFMSLPFSTKGITLQKLIEMGCIFYVDNMGNVLRDEAELMRKFNKTLFTNAKDSLYVCNSLENSLMFDSIFSKDVFHCLSYANTCIGDNHFIIFHQDDNNPVHVLCDTFDTEVVSIILSQLKNIFNNPKRGKRGGGSKKNNYIGGGDKTYIKIGTNCYNIDILLDILKTSDELSNDLNIVLLNMFLEYYNNPSKVFTLYEDISCSNPEEISLEDSFQLIISNYELAMQVTVFSIYKNGNEGLIAEKTNNVIEKLNEIKERSITAKEFGAGLVNETDSNRNLNTSSNLDTSFPDRSFANTTLPDRSFDRSFDDLNSSIHDLNSSIHNLNISFDPDAALDDNVLGETSLNVVTNESDSITGRKSPIAVNGGSKKRKRSKSKNKKTIKNKNKNKSKSKKKSIKKLKIKRRNQKNTIKK